MRRVTWGDRVQVEYTGWLEDGSVFDASLYSGPLTFTVGEGTVFKGVEQLLIGMGAGESKTEKLPSDLAFGPYRPELTCVIARDWLVAQQVEPKVGLGLEVRSTDGELVYMRLTEVAGDRVTLDANHHLAGQDVVLNVVVVAILDAPLNGHPAAHVA
jgi:peptidylprolyl isomerase